jgi:hypothetical protein
LPWQGWIGAGVLPVLLSLGVHLAVVTWRHRPVPVVSVPAPRVQRPAAEAAPPAADVPARAARPTRRRQRPKTRPASTNPTADEARRRYAAREGSCAEIALALGVSKRAVELWTKELRQERGA